MKNLKNIFFIAVLAFMFVNHTYSLENKILFKVNNDIITSLDILHELKYLEVVNEQFKNTDKKQAFEIAKRSLIREKIKENELKKLVKELRLEDQFLNNFIN